jgi:hypothetical protein
MLIPLHHSPPESNRRVVVSSRFDKTRNGQLHATKLLNIPPSIRTRRKASHNWRCLTQNAVGMLSICRLFHHLRPIPLLPPLPIAKFPISTKTPRTVLPYSFFFASPFFTLTPLPRKSLASGAPLLPRPSSSASLSSSSLCFLAAPLTK